jgi:hypothetical protein
MCGNCCAEQTLANVPQGGQRLWAAVVFAYAFNLHALWLLDKEYTEYSELRQDFLCYGDPDLVPQTRYTAMVEYLPAELRSGVALAAYYDALFPGERCLLSCVNRLSSYLVGCTSSSVVTEASMFRCWCFI